MDFMSRYNFHSMPFTREIAVDRRFRLPMYDEALDALWRTVEQRMSAGIISPAGTGKTVVLRALEDRLPEARYRVRYIKVCDLSRRDMSREIACAVGIEPTGFFPVLFRRLQDHFLSCADTDGVRPVIIIDDSHEMRPDVLGMLRLITNFDMDSRLVVSIVLSGQSHLRDLLRRDDLEDVARRMAHYATLRPLSREESRGYIKHRCTIAGATTFPFEILPRRHLRGRTR